MNRNALTETLTTTLEEALKFRGSCGFMMIAVDNLARINEFVRLRRRRRGDRGGRAAAAQPHARRRHARPLFLEQVRRGAQELHARRPHDGRRPVSDRGARGRGADRARSGCRHHHHRRCRGAAPRAHGRRDPGACAGIARIPPRRSGAARSSPYRPNVELEALRQENVRATDKIITALNERRILLAFEPVVTTSGRQTAFHECLMRIRRTDGSVVPATAVVPVAEQLGLVRLIDHRVIELVVCRTPRHA